MGATRRGRPGEPAGMGQEERGGGSAAGVSAGRPFGRAPARAIAPPAGASAAVRAGTIAKERGSPDGVPGRRGKLVRGQDLYRPRSGGIAAASTRGGARAPVNI
jgi:hypothetical protein